ncbi:RNA polymerase sigma-70 factor (ECF subfamily) [Novosphingobium kunmingense]|uniref:RNA polymerase sigma-70 factor (ECF subfamily) n=1 Tax=Novosphingobium kunmingense TaxID=1211806 RepID=A0A2N0HJC2_9SPHN|nr:RNA polymerase sigma factor [Novosphingobium kunmingense]PKB19044.1 RNA polymerase sigma-70 factor (ECF subfamily) [Novosphingobium kunmingense]
MGVVQDDDAALVAQALAGRQAAFSALLARHRDPVFRLARHHTGNDSEALDVTQECFVSAFANLARYDPARPLRAWLLRIALNKCRDWWRKRAVRRLFAFARPLEEAAEVADLAPDPEQALSAARETARIRRALAALPAQLKEPLILCAIEGLAQGEAALMLGISRKAVETRIYRARQKLSETLEGRG